MGGTMCSARESTSWMATKENVWVKPEGPPGKCREADRAKKMGRYFRFGECAQEWFYMDIVYIVL